MRVKHSGNSHRKRSKKDTRWQSNEEDINTEFSMSRLGRSNDTSQVNNVFIFVVVFSLSSQEKLPLKTPEGVVLVSQKVVCLLITHFLESLPGDNDVTNDKQSANA